MVIGTRPGLLPRRFAGVGLVKGPAISPLGANNVFKTLSYYWSAAQGYRLKPWQSPYLRWRFETFLGREAAELTARKFFRLTWKYRDHMERFVDWAAERRRLQHRRHT